MTVAAPTSTSSSVPFPQAPRRSQPVPVQEVDWYGAGMQVDVEKGTLGGYTEPAREDLTFSDLLDLVNPLQHIPGVGHIYRAITGDTIKPAVRVAGGVMFGGPLGIVAAAGAAVLETALGGDPLTRIANAIVNPDDASPSPARTDVAAVAGTAGHNDLAQLPAIVPEKVASATSTGPVDISHAADAELAALMAASGASTQAAGTPAATAAPALPQTDLAAASAGGGRGKSIRTYFAEAVPRAVTPTVVRPMTTAAAETTETTRQPPAIAAAKKTASMPEAPPISTNDAGDAAVPAGMVTPKVTVNASSAPTSVGRAAGAQTVPPWFSERVLDGLDRYRGNMKSTSSNAAARSEVSG